MRSLQRTVLSKLILLIALIVANSAFADKTQERLDKRATKIAATIKNIQSDEASRIPAKILQKAKGIIVLRQFEAGLIFGGKGGFGIAYKRDENGEWGSPAWIKTGEGSWELQLGAQTLNVVLLVMNDEGFGILKKEKFRIGVDAPISGGPAESEADIEITSETPIFVYLNTAGVYASATIDGGFFEAGYFLPDHKSNLATYQNSKNVWEIISDPDLEAPPYSQRIISTLKGIEEK